jgi:hypothetical protein
MDQGRFSTVAYFGKQWSVQFWDGRTYFGEIVYVTSAVVFEAVTNWAVHGKLPRPILTLAANEVSRIERLLQEQMQ